MPICPQVNVIKMLTLCRLRRVFLYQLLLSVVDGVLVEADVCGDDDCMVISFWSLPLTTKNDTDTILILLGTDVSFSAITFL